MATVERLVRQARTRLWINRWLRQWGFVATGFTAAWVVAWIADRLCSLRWPMGWAALAAAVGSMLVSLAWLIRTRDSELAAAAALDEAAGLKERITTGIFVAADADDAFVRAVAADAQRAAGGLVARRLIPLRWAPSLSCSGLALLVAVCSLLIPEMDLLRKHEARAKAEARLADVRRVRSLVAKPVSVISELAKKIGDPELEKNLKSLEDALERDKGADPDILRREAVKQLDRLADALKAKAAEDRFRAFNETKKRLMQVGPASDPKSEAARLIDSLASGDFKEAAEQARKLQQELARRAREGGVDPAKAEELRRQLRELAQKLEQAAQDRQSRVELQNAGLAAEEARRVLETLAKKDPRQLEKMARELAERLKGGGLSPEKMQQMLEKMAQRQQASEKCSKLSQQLSRAAMQCQQGNAQKAADQMGEAAEQLSELEQLEQGLNELEGQIARLNDAQDQLSESSESGGEGRCTQCRGSGFRPDGSPCPHCNGTGDAAGGNRGRASGARGRDDSAQFGLKNEKARTRQGRGGAIIGQQFVKGAPLKGKSQAEFYDAASAAELEVTDALNKGRIHRSYRKGVKRYFDRLGDELRADDGAKSSDPQPPADAEPDKKP